MLYFVMILIISYFCFDIYKYNKCKYKIETNNNYLKVRLNKGLFGEYLTYQILESLSGYKKITVNTYIPKKNGETTEVDLICVHETGIYCIESKNYSGWIFGDEKSQYWTQSLKGGMKNRFFNPIMQNEGHIKHLKEFLSADYSGEFYSVIVFSQRCDLKKIKMNSKDILLMRRPFLKRHMSRAIVKRNQILSNLKVDSIYDKLIQYSGVSEEEKLQHINNIKRKK